MEGVSKQRARYTDALRLSQDASASLQPLHDDLSTISPTFDGIVYFAKDRWHENNASAVATVQPRSDDIDRFAFYKEKIAHRRVDLGATALGLGLKLRHPQLLKSRMNPDTHTTWAHRACIDGDLKGGVQAAFNSHYGAVPNSTRAIDDIWQTHESTVLEVANAFDSFSKEVYSIGDVLELEAPATPNAFIVSWDLTNSTGLAYQNYGALRNYLLDAKNIIQETTNKMLHDTDGTYTHDTGDGQDIAIWIPETSDAFDRADQTDVRGFGQTKILPLIHTLIATHNSLVESSYRDIEPAINFVVGLGYVEHDAFDGRTSAEYWNNARILKQHPEHIISYTKNATETLFTKD